MDRGNRKEPQVFVGDLRGNELCSSLLRQYHQNHRRFNVRQLVLGCLESQFREKLLFSAGVVCMWKLNLWAGFYRARYRLYRNQILQENTRWKTLDEIYKIYMLLHRSDVNISAKFRQTFSHFSAKFCKFWAFSLNLLRFWWKFVGISPFIVENVEHSWNFWISDEF